MAPFPSPSPDPSDPPRPSLGGRLAGVLPGFEARPSQERMAAAVARTLEDSGVLLVEAGTGTGKSLAYLLPALERALDGGGRVLLSTHTLTLQSQLVNKDVPLALAALGREAAVARVVGRGNYLCRLRLGLGLEQARGDLFGPELSHLTALEEWADHGGGLREEAPFAVPQAAWEQVQVEAFGCLGRRCPKAQGCAFLRDREALREAQVVVANHALLMADLAARREGSELLPPCETLVVDEAHHLAAAAAEHLGLRLTRMGLNRTLDRLRDPRRKSGLMDRLPSQRLPGLMATCRAAVAGLFDAAARLQNDVALPPGALEDGLSQPLAELAAELRQSSRPLSELPEAGALVAESSALASRFDSAAVALRAWLEQDEGESVFWMELEQGRFPSLRSAPLDVGPLLSEHLYANHRAVVLTSATLSVAGDFGFVGGQLGLPEDVRTLALPEAFDYASQVEMHLSAAVPDPKDGDAYLEALEGAVRKALERSQGRAFVLVTSFAQLDRLAEALRPFIEERGWLCLRQARGARRDELLREFREHGRAVLFGAASFWEGVDVPGEALSCVVVTRLPFAVPDGPLEKARQGRVRARGGEPFRDLSLPEAVLRLKQGFGRLIRHGSDRGWFVLLDPRVLTRPYGRVFLKSLPECPRFVDGEPMG